MIQSSKLLSRTVREWSEAFMHRSMRDFKRVMNDTGLSFSQINILMCLMHGGCEGVSEIGERMGFTNAAASQAIDRLVQLDLVKRSENPQDRRVKQLELAPKGLALMQKGIEARTRWVEDVTDSLTTAQQETIIAALTLLTEAARARTD